MNATNSPNKLDFFVLTRQAKNHNKLNPKQILGVLAGNSIKNNNSTASTYFINTLATQSKHNQEILFKPIIKYKNCGKRMLQLLLKAINKDEKFSAIEALAAPNNSAFYQKLGFEQLTSAHTHGEDCYVSLKDSSLKKLEKGI